MTLKQNNSKLLITGASGFIGARLNECAASRWSVRRAVRLRCADDVDSIVVGNINADTDWFEALKGIDVVVHLAARVHVMRDTADDPLTEFRNVNTRATLNLARQAEKCGVKRFIYLSSIKVNGEKTYPDKPFTAEDLCMPLDPYAISKYETEQGLLELASETNMDVVIIRPPLVYGPKVKANFLNMIKWLDKGIPLPFGRIKNKRSFIALDNLVDFILTCAEHPAASNQVFLVSDGEDLSTTELLDRITRALNKRSLLFPVNDKILTFIFKLFGAKDLAQRLCCSLQVDISKAENFLNWVPPGSMDDELGKTAEYFLGLYRNN